MTITLTDRSADDIERAIREAGTQQDVGPVDILPPGAGWSISQNPKELAAFLRKMDVLGVRSMLEIGTQGGGLARFCGEVMGWDVVSIDYRDAATTQGYTFIKTYSRDYTPDREFDLIFIDGDHHYNGVRDDYNRFAPLAGKVVALHDVYGLHQCDGVKKFYEEIKGPGWVVELNYDWPLGIAWYAKPQAKAEAPKRTRKGAK